MTRLGATATIIVAAAVVGLGLHIVKPREEPDFREYHAGVKVQRDEEIVTVTVTFEGKKPRAHGQEVRAKIVIGGTTVVGQADPNGEIVATSPRTYAYVIKKRTSVVATIKQGNFPGAFGCELRIDGVRWDEDPRWGNTVAICDYHG